MAYTLKKWDQSNYEIVITCTTEEQAQERKHVLKYLSETMSIPGFRKGHVPADVVENNLKPGVLSMQLDEHILSHALQTVLKEHPEIRFIGDPYGYQKDEKDWVITMSISLDEYPQVEVKNDKWEKETIAPFQVKVTSEEVDDAFMTLRKNYANYEDTDVIALDTVSKIALQFVNKEGKEVDKGTIYVGDQEFQENDFWKKEFVDRKKGDTFEMKYSEKTLPQVMFSKSEEKPAKVLLTVKDVKKQILADFTEDQIEKFFGKQSDVKTEQDLKDYIEKTIAVQKEQTALVQSVEEYLKTVMDKSFSVVIPKTMVDEEFRTRIQSLEQRFWSQEKVKQYLSSLSEEDANKFFEDIQKVATESLSKFFILKEISEQLHLDINWESDAKDLFVEKALYAYFNPQKADTESSEKTPKKRTTKKKTEEDSNPSDGGDASVEVKVPKKRVCRKKKEDADVA